MNTLRHKVTPLFVSVLAHIAAFWLIGWGMSKLDVLQAIWQGGSRGSWKDHVQWIDLKNFSIPSPLFSPSPAIPTPIKPTRPADKILPLPQKSSSPSQTKAESSKKNSVSAPEPSASVGGQGVGEGLGDGVGHGLDKTGVSSAQAPSVLAAIRKKIVARQTYPASAREQKLEGKVGMALKIRQDGSLDSVRVTQSSGHKILDDAALQAVQRAAPLPYFPNTIGFALVYDLK